MSSETQIASSPPALKAFYGISWMQAEPLLRPKFTAYFEYGWAYANGGYDAGGNVFFHVGDGPDSILITSMDSDFASVSSGEHVKFAYAIVEEPDAGPLYYVAIFCIPRLEVVGWRDERKRKGLLVFLKDHDLVLALIDPVELLPVDSMAGVPLEHGAICLPPPYSEAINPDLWQESVAEFEVKLPIRDDELDELMAELEAETSAVTPVQCSCSSAPA